MPVTVRLAISMGIVPLALGTTSLFDHFSRDWLLFDFLTTPLGDRITFLLPAVLMFAVHFFIWWRTVRWTLHTRLVYLIATAIFLGLVALAAFPMNMMFGAWSFEKVAVWLLAIGFSAVLNGWAYGTSPRRPPDDGRVPCPKCGYDLRAQQECRCPECGHAFTLASIAGGQLTRSPVSNT